MKLSSQRFTMEDFKEQGNWLEKLFSPLNTFIGDLVRGMSNQVTIEDNLFQEIREISFKNTASNFPYTFKTKFSTIPKGLFPIYLFNSTLNSYSTETPLVVWDYGNNEIKITQISGLTANSSYIIRLVLIYG